MPSAEQRRTGFHDSGHLGTSQAGPRRESPSPRGHPRRDSRDQHATTEYPMHDLLHEECHKTAVTGFEPQIMSTPPPSPSSVWESMLWMPFILELLSILIALIEVELNRDEEPEPNGEQDDNVDHSRVPCLSGQTNKLSIISIVFEEESNLLDELALAFQDEPNPGGEYESNVDHSLPPLLVDLTNQLSIVFEDEPNFRNELEELAFDFQDELNPHGEYEIKKR